MYYVYILKSEKDQNIYTGYTSNLKLRISQHEKGLVTSTKHRRPLLLVYYQAFFSKEDAKNEEKFLKSGGEAKKHLKMRIKNSLESGTISSTPAVAERSGDGL